MVMNTEFDSFEQQLLEIVGEFQSISSSENRLRDALRTECNRAEAAEAALSAAERASSEARASAAAATAAATQAAAALAQAKDEIIAVKMQLELSERQRSLAEERCSELLTQMCSVERELQQLRPLQGSSSNLQRQYVELQDKIRCSTELAQKEASRLESELRRVEHCAAGGSEVRERARLAAAAHARERRLAAAEQQHTTRDLAVANAEIARLKSANTELQRLLGEHNEYSSNIISSKTISNIDAEALAETRTALEAERAGAAKLEKALAAALKDNAALAAMIHAEDASSAPAQPDCLKQDQSNITALDSFLAD